MRFAAGKHDRPIKIERMILEQDDFGQEIPKWVLVHQAYGQVLPNTGTERFTSDGKHSQEIARVNIRYKDGLDPTMRVQLNCKIYRILAVTEIGRREATELFIERWA